MKQPTGGPAFPPTHDPESHPSGITLRDYFAAKAMQAIIPDDRDYPDLARIAYEISDAMLQTRTIAQAVHAHGIDKEQVNQAVCTNCMDTGTEHGVYKNYPCAFCRSTVQP